MLRTLYVSDLALIRRLSVDFDEGFSVLTGETGAGKSLILDSLNLFLTAKGAASLVRRGAEKMEVSLFFDEISPRACEAIRALLPEAVPEEGITLTRTVTAAGKSLCKCNGRSLPFSQICATAGILLSVLGQHESGGLLEEKNHGAFFDGALSPEGLRARERYGALYGEYLRLERETEGLFTEAKSLKENKALYEFQMAQIARVKPKLGEEEALEKKLALLQGTEKTCAALRTADRALSGGEKGKGACFLLEAAASRLEKLQDESLSALSEELSELAQRAKAAAEEIGSHLAAIGGDSDTEDLMDRIRRRLDALYQLKLKYGCADTKELLAFFEDCRKKREAAETVEDELSRAEARLREAKRLLEEAGDALSRHRAEAKDRLEKEIHGVLAYLELPKMRFFVSLEPCECASCGKERVRFEIAANTGEGRKSLAKVASGGELSRLMLALQLKLGRGRDADTLVFDEIDTGISGATSQKIGICLRELSTRSQVFCVTHSAQVATLSDRHYRVQKKEAEGRTETELSLLEEEEHIKECARLLGGKRLSSEAYLAARNLQTEGLREWKRQQGVSL